MNPKFRIYEKAEKSIFLIDDYISLKTLHLLKSCKPGVEITLFSDNVSRPKVEESDLLDFQADTGLAIELKPTHELVHDRYVVVDYGRSNEEVYHCGSSSKDSGRSYTTIMKSEYPQDFHRLIDLLFGR